MPRIALSPPEASKIVGEEEFRRFFNGLLQIGGGWVFFLEWDSPDPSLSRSPMEHNERCMKNYKAIVAFSDGGGSHSQMISLDFVPAPMWKKELDAWKADKQMRELYTVIEDTRPDWGKEKALPKTFKAAWGIGE